jgi:hypothetical protein
MTQLRDIHTCAFVNHPYDRVRELLRGDPVGILQRATHSATVRARALVATMHAQLGPVQIDEKVLVEVTSMTDDPPGQLGPCTRLSLSWRASSGPDLFPMEATLDLMTLGPREAQLDFRGTYRPRLGALGATIDKVIGHRIMEAAVRRFVEDIAERLSTEVAAA